MDSPLATGIYRFPGWELRRDERVLVVNGVRSKVGSRAFDVLLRLVERHGRVVGKSELMNAAWPGLVVEENNLSVQISALRKVLGANCIGNVAGQGYQLTARIDTAESASPDSLSLGPPSLLFGRGSEQQALLSMVGVKQLVSVVGTGGVGKTSLAKSVLFESLAQWQDGVHWIDLAPLRDGAQLTQLLATTLGIFAEDPAQNFEDLVRALSQLSALVALDNCEHLLDAVVALLGPLLRQAPNIRWLVTSREPLHLVDESIYRLGPLDVPLPGTQLDPAMRFGSLALFRERAQAVDSDFALSDENVGLAIELCRQLDGLPLAIEMAAARVATLGLRGVHDQIDQRLRLRSTIRGRPARHDTLLQTYEWSYGLLSKSEQCVFRRLEPFAGGFTPQMAQHLCCSVEGDFEFVTSWEMLDALSALVDKSLVQRERTTNGSGERLHLLESARDYARVRLEEAAEVDALHRRHAEVVADWFASAQHELERWRDSDWAEKYLPERRNVCVALSWTCTAQQPDLLARLVAALAQLDGFAHTDAEIVRYSWPQAVLEASALPLRARAHLELGWAHFLDGNRQLGTDLTLRALADLETLDDADGIYSALTRLIRLYDGRPGMEAAARDMWTRLKQIDESQVSLRSRLTCQSTVALLFEGGRSVERLEELHRIAQHAGFDAQAAVCRLNITDELLILGRFDDVVTTTDAMLGAGEPLVRVRAVMYYNRAHALVRMGRVREAKEAAQAMLKALPRYAHLVMDLFSVVALQTGRPENAALMVGRSDHIKRERDLHHDASEAAMIRETRERLERTLEGKRLAELMRQGSGMSTLDVLSLAWDSIDGLSNSVGI